MIGRLRVHVGLDGTISGRAMVYGGRTEPAIMSRCHSGPDVARDGPIAAVTLTLACGHPPMALRAGSYGCGGCGHPYGPSMPPRCARRVSCGPDGINTVMPTWAEHPPPMSTCVATIACMLRVCPRSGIGSYTTALQLYRPDTIGSSGRNALNVTLLSYLSLSYCTVRIRYLIVSYLVISYLILSDTICLVSRKGKGKGREGGEEGGRRREGRGRRGGGGET